MSSGECGEGLRASFFRWMVCGEEGNLRNLFGVGCAGAADDGEAAASGQVCLQWLEGVNAYGSLVEASVLCVRLFCVGKMNFGTLTNFREVWSCKKTAFLR